MQWVPAHCGFPGNEKADEVATLGAKGREKDNSVTFQEKKTLVRAALGQRTERDDFHFLDRWQQVVVMRLRHRTQPNQRPHAPDSNSGFEDEQILQRCALLQTVRMIIIKVFIKR